METSCSCESTGPAASWHCRKPFRAAGTNPWLQQTCQPVAKPKHRLKQLTKLLSTILAPRGSKPPKRSLDEYQASSAPLPDNNEGLSISGDVTSTMYTLQCTAEALSMASPRTEKAEEEGKQREELKPARGPSRGVLSQCHSQSTVTTQPSCFLQSELCVLHKQGCILKDLPT